MNLPLIFKRAEKLAIDNSPALLTAIGVAGTLSTAYLVGKASFKAAALIEQEQARLNLFEKSHPLENKEKLQLVWKEYAPAIATGALTISCIIGANRIGSKRAAAMAAAYSLSEKAYAEYRDKVVEKIGEKKEQAARDELAQDRVNANPVSTNNVIIT